ncbi:GAF and ANTAR domain-containing protein [Streptomyces griseorubiginosus]|uniref:GAF and ANTAR domain-containing protein n=1 Tax=Streptomyces griseorubiginosus TaxID=67304 RepID=UPI002E820DEC|nr:GAF and ANTAR domain-containing protein [Streptomyces griseorubiginosus]WUB45671.1 GAF and ANTAR domain-containing protein [Streptomyces griseorubiginosus]WUB54189.1 GAF and ANTAR domain-containing protein [Streptomyces griseorubiginosus]
MNRELRLTRAFVDLADTLPASFDPLDLFARLGGHCTELLAVDAVGVVMADSRGALRNMVASDDDLLLLDLFQVQQEEGPSVDCFRTGEVVAADDLREGARWPRYTAQALEAGYVSVHVLPLRLEGRPIGAVSLLKREADALPTEDLAVAQGMSDVAALTLTHWPTEARRPHDLLTSLQAAVSAKASVELARGLLAEYAGISFSEALELLRRHAEQQGRSLTAVARALAERSLAPEDVVARQPRLS